MQKSEQRCFQLDADAIPEWDFSMSRILWQAALRQNLVLELFAGAQELI
jgi:hypothetical protein